MQMGVFERRTLAFLAALGLMLAALASAPSQAQTITTVAGGWNPDNRPATEANLFHPNDLVRDAAGNLYVADTGDNRIRKISPDGTISTVAGNGNYGQPKLSVAATDSPLDGPTSLAIDSSGNLYFASDSSFRIYKIATNGVIGLLAGTADGLGDTSEGVVATSASVRYPAGLAVDSAGNLYFSEPTRNRVRRVGTDGLVSTFAGTGVSGNTGDDGPAVSAQLNYPQDVAVGADDTVYIGETNNQAIRRVLTDGTITLFAHATLNFSGQMTVTADNHVLVADPSFYSVWKAGADGIVTLIAGTGMGSYSGDGGKATLAELCNPSGIAIDGSGNIYIGDRCNNRVRKINTGGIISTVAGSGEYPYRYHGDGGPATAAGINTYSIDVDAAGKILISDSDDFRVRQIDASGTITTLTRPPTGVSHLAPPQGVAWRADDAPLYAGDDGEIHPATDTFDELESTCSLWKYCAYYSLAASDDGRLFFSDSQRVFQSNGFGTTTVIAGSSTRGYAGDEGTATLAQLNIPLDEAVAPDGQIYIADAYNHRIRRIDLAGVIHTAAGTGSAGFSGDGGPATSAQISLPVAIAFDPDGALYIADAGNHRIRRVGLDGVISTVAGTGAAISAGDGGSATAASFKNILDLAIAADGTAYVAEYDRVRKFAVPHVAATAPSAPGTPVATAGDASATVTFSAPASNGGATITGYTVVSNPAGGVDQNAGQNVLTHQISGLSNGVGYTFTAVATNSRGNSPASAPSNKIFPKAPILPTLSIQDLFVKETNGKMTYYVNAVLQGGNSSGSVMFNVSTVDGTATSGTDYSSVSLRFLSSSATGNFFIPVEVLGDTAPEPDETFSVILSNVTGATLGKATATVTILDDDGGGPQAFADDYRYATGQTLVVDAAAGVLQNDSDPSGGSLTVSLSVPPSFGTVALNADGSFTYTPASADVPFDAFVYKACNASGACARASANLASGFSLYPPDRYVWYVPSASDPQHQGFLRFINRSSSEQTVTLWGIDAVGRLAPRHLTLTVPGLNAQQINSQDLEYGNAQKGLAGAFGAGTGAWTVIASADPEKVEIFSYVRTPDGFLTSMHDRVPGDGIDWNVPMFNPAENTNQVSILRIVNFNPTATDVLIDGYDDAGNKSGTVTTRIPAMTSIELKSPDLESGNPGKGLAGALGNGTGKWRLHVSATQRITVQSLLSDPLGYLTNLSFPDVQPTTSAAIEFLPRASNTAQQGFLRVSNLSDAKASVTVKGTDDFGAASTGNVTFTLAPHESRQFTSQDLQHGNATKGSGSLGAENGDWRLSVSSTSTIEAMALIRTPDGFLTSVSENASHNPNDGSGVSFYLPTVNPAKNVNQVSSIRVRNFNTVTEHVLLDACDDLHLQCTTTAHYLDIGPGQVVELTATDIEQGNPAKGFPIGIGSGEGKWRIGLHGSAYIVASSLLRDPNGYLTDLSTNPNSTSLKLDP